MKWTTSSEITKGNEVAVPTEGAAYSFKCDNYKWVKLNLCSEDGVEVKITSDDKIEREWGVIECKDNVLGVTFNSNNSGKDRNVNVKVTAGNIFDSFTFKQKTN